MKTNINYPQGLIILSLFLFSPLLNAAPSFTLHIDNDFIYGTDREYTGGFKFKFTEDEIDVNNTLLSPLTLGSYL